MWHSVDPEADTEDKINALVEGRKLLANASYFAFTATPKNKTLEVLGEIIENEMMRVNRSVSRLIIIR